MENEIDSLEDKQQNVSETTPETEVAESAPVSDVESDEIAAAECAADENENNDTEESESGRRPRRERTPRPVIPVTQEMMDESRKTLAIMLDYLSLDANIRVESKPSKINLLVSSEEAGRIIGRKGQTLENLQLILNRIMQRTNPDFPKVYIDIDGYAPGGKPEGGRRERRSSGRGERPERGGRRQRTSDEGGMSPHDEILRQQALDAAKEVRTFGEPKTLPPMNAHDRRIIHVTLENEADLSTESEGDGVQRSVVISLKK